MNYLQDQWLITISNYLQSIITYQINNYLQVYNTITFATVHNLKGHQGQVRPSVLHLGISQFTDYAVFWGLLKKERVFLNADKSILLLDLAHQILFVIHIWLHGFYLSVEYHLFDYTGIVGSLN